MNTFSRNENLDDSISLWLLGQYLDISQIVLYSATELYKFGRSTAPLVDI